MGLITKQINEEGFHATVHTLTCNVTNRPLAEIIEKQPDSSLYAYVKATSPFSEGADSGVHKITGVLAFGGVESPRFPTVVKDITFDEKDDGTYVTLEVISDEKKNT